MSKTQLLRAPLLLAAPLALPVILFTAGCGGGTESSTPSTPAAASTNDGHDHDDHAGHDHGAEQDGHDHDGHDHGAEEQGAATAAAATPADDHAGHDHGPDEDHDHSAGALKINNPPPLGDGSGPRLMYPVGMESHDFGRVMQGTVADHTFELNNDGTEDLIIKQVKPTCGCTVAQVQVENESGEVVDYVFGDPIVPGRKVHVPAKLHTKNKSGHQTTRINIFSNDPRGTIQLGLEADIDPFFNIAPRFLNFGQVSVGDVLEKKAVVSTSRGTPVGLEMVEQSLPAGTVADLVPVNPDAEGRAARWDLTVTVGPELTEGNLARAINLVSDEEIPGSEPGVDGNASKYQATITVSAQVVGPFSYNPPYLSMGLVRPGQVATRTVTIESHDDGYSFADKMPQVQVVGLQNPGADESGAVSFQEWKYADRFSPTIRPVEGKNAIEIELRLEGMPDDATGSFRGTLVVDLGHPDKERITLVITGVCRGGPPAK